MTTADTSAERAIEDRIVSSAVAALEMFSIHLGRRLGLYRALADGPTTVSELAAAAGIDQRYAREWLEQQAVTGFLVASQDDGVRRFALPAGAAEALTDERSLNFLAPAARMVAASAGQLPALLEAYRTGRGVSWEQLGEDAREGQAALNRPWFDRELGPALARAPEVDEVLRRPGTRIVDVGCGGGWSTLALARAYPEAILEGVDVDAPSVALAEAARAGEPAEVADRVRFRTVDGASLVAEDGQPYDAAFAFECVHDMARPVDVLAAVRHAVRDDGLVVVMDEAVEDEFVAPGSDVERFMYGWSVLLCLPDGLSSQPSAGTGTVMRRSVLDGYAREAGFAGGAAVLPLQDFSFFRFYRLVP
jgi:SAM-dependent methyltransferase